MHTMFTTDIARQIVNDRIRAAETTRRARLFSRRATDEATTAGTGTTERVVRRAPQQIQGDVVGAC